MLEGRTVVDTGRAVLVWEPKRVVPSYAVPREDIDAELAPAAKASDNEPVTRAAAGRAARLRPERAILGAHRRW